MTPPEENQIEALAKKWQPTREIDGLEIVTPFH